MALQRISFLLDRFEKLYQSEKGIRDSIREKLQNLLKTEFSPESVTFKNGVLSIETTPLMKNEVFLRREEITALLEKDLTIKIKSVR